MRKKSMKARFFKGDIVRSKDYRTYKVEEIQHDEHGRRVVIAFPFGFAGMGIRFFDSDDSYVPVR